MRCGICTRPDAKAINLELLQRAGRRTGVMTAMAKRLGVHRATLWRHKKEHLKIYTSKHPPKTKDLSFEERARLLSNDADRLQCQAENGLPREQMDQAMRALALRVKLLELESRFAGRPLTQERAEVSLEDPDEEARALREFQEVVGEQ
jgi:Bacterial regulatory protein, Fis family